MPSDFTDNWETQARKGTVELCVLHALRDRRLYGYQLVKRLEVVPGMVVSAGTIYPMMSRLQREGLVEGTLEPSPEGPARKYYSLTPRGRQVLAEIDSRWAALQRGIDELRRSDDETD